MTNVLFSYSNLNYFNKNSFSIFEILNKWFEANNLTLNLNKIRYIWFARKTKIANNIVINYYNKSINSKI
jgi:hypothetical protein